MTTHAGQDVAQLIDIVVRRGGRVILDGVSLRITAGRVIALLGHSGAGKSTLLQVLTGDLQPESGVVDTGGHTLKQGIVHQAPLLLPWLTAIENASLGQRYKSNHDVRPELVPEMLDLLGLTAISHHYPDGISGGQAQRVALARALSVAPDLLLLDEPFSALDPVTRAELQSWLRLQVSKRGWTAVLVTHDIDEALAVADEIVLLVSGGRIAARWDNVPTGHFDPDRLTAQQNELRAQIRAAYTNVDENLVAGSTRGGTNE